MMKLLILLLLLVSTAYSNRQSCADEINALRSRYANELSIANMNKLIYNPKLETKILEKLESSGGCPDNRKMKNVRSNFRKSQILAGPPGTRCSENRTAYSNGLCSPENSGKSGKYVRKEWVGDFNRGLYELFRALRFG